MKTGDLVEVDTVLDRNVWLSRTYLDAGIYPAWNVTTIPRADGTVSLRVMPISTIIPLVPGIVIDVINAHHSTRVVVMMNGCLHAFAEEELIVVTPS